MNRHKREMQRGSSLPFTWILLIATVVLVYFAGWIVLVIVAGAALLITLGVFLYDFFKTDENEKSTIIDFWFYSNQSLSACWKLIAADLKVESDSYGQENVWEWFEAKSKDGLYQYNISRKHKDYDYPVHIRMNCFGNDVTRKEVYEDLGPLFAKGLKTDIKAGSVRYLDADDFEFTQEREFRYRNPLTAE
jgi:hypothetical protein